MTARRPADAPAPPMSDEQREAVRAELVRLTLGGRPHRLELEGWRDALPVPTRRPKRRRGSR